MIRSPRPNHTPCSETCAHADCITARMVAYAPCVRCDQPIGYDRQFHRLANDFNLLEHHNCETPR